MLDHFEQDIEVQKDGKILWADGSAASHGAVSRLVRTRPQGQLGLDQLAKLHLLARFHESPWSSV
jgi:hypothetical protein